MHGATLGCRPEPRAASRRHIAAHRCPARGPAHTARQARHRPCSPWECTSASHGVTCLRCFWANTPGRVMMHALDSMLDSRARHKYIANSGWACTAHCNAHPPAEFHAPTALHAPGLRGELEVAPPGDSARLGRYPVGRGAQPESGGHALGPPRLLCGRSRCVTRGHSITHYANDWYGQDCLVGRTCCRGGEW